MPQRDPHQCSHQQILDDQQEDGTSWLVVESRWSKAEAARSLHVACTSFQTMTICYADFLRLFGFQRAKCSLLPDSPYGCVWREVPADFDLRVFRERALTGVSAFRRADDALLKCGLRVPLPFPEIYYQGSGYRSRELMPASSGDGHLFDRIKNRTHGEDSRFRYFYHCYTHAGRHGFAYHVSPKTPLDPDDVRALELTGFQRCDECPFFDFEPCFWVATESEANDRDESEQLHSLHKRYHSRYPENLPKGLEELSNCRREMLILGWDLLDSVPSIDKQAGPVEREGTWKYDLAISFAGAQRVIAEEISVFLRDEGISVFYDEFVPDELWGADLPEHLYKVYSEQARFCLMLVSKEYVEREWTVWEKRAAIDRLLRERGKTYVLPLRCDEAEVPSVLARIGGLDLTRRSLDEVKALLLKKLRDSA